MASPAALDAIDPRKWRISVSLKASLSSRCIEPILPPRAPNCSWRGATARELDVWDPGGARRSRSGSHESADDQAAVSREVQGVLPGPCCRNAGGVERRPQGRDL